MDQLIVDATKAKDRLTSEMNTVILSTISEDKLPNSSYAPAFVDDNNNFYIYISSLSQHTRNLLKNPVVSIMMMLTLVIISILAAIRQLETKILQQRVVVLKTKYQFLHG